MRTECATSSGAYEEGKASAYVAQRNARASPTMRLPSLSSSVRRSCAAKRSRGETVTVGAFRQSSTTLPSTTVLRTGTRVKRERVHTLANTQPRVTRTHDGPSSEGDRAPRWASSRRPVEPAARPDWNSQTNMADRVEQKCQVIREGHSPPVRWHDAHTPPRTRARRNRPRGANALSRPPSTRAGDTRHPPR